MPDALRAEAAQIQQFHEHLAVAFANALSGAFTGAQGALQGRIPDATERAAAYLAALHEGYRTTAAQVQTWRVAAESAGNSGIAKIMDKWADKFATVANEKLTPLVDAKQRLDSFVGETNGKLAQLSDFKFLKYAGPSFDALAMGNALASGDRRAFAIACGSLLLAETAAVVAILFLPVGTPVLAALIIAGMAAGLASHAAEPLYNVFGGSLEDLFRKVPDSVWAFFDNAITALFRRDPLTLDLDGDGLETVGSAQSNILFDHDGDGILTGTGWVLGDDGFLVLDRNGNGAIDSGLELFGDSTPLASGGNARDGFEALAQEDTNGDGIVSAADARWNDLRVWRDANQDGVSRTNC